MNNYYEVLGLPPEASQDEITKMYRKLSKKYHPDKNEDDADLRQWADSMMKTLNEAYDVLGDPAKRAQYDHQRHLLQAFRPAPRPSPPPPGSEHDPTDILSQLRYHLIFSGPGLSALSFGILGLSLTKNPLIGIAGAIFGVYLGSKLGTTRINWIFYGILIGGFLGALTPLNYTGLIIGGTIGGMMGFGLSKGR